MNRECKICQEVKELTSFTKNKTFKDGLTFICIKCGDDMYKNRYSDSKEYRKAASIKFRTNNFELQMLLATKARAKKIGLDFNLEIEDIIIPKYCPYLGIKLTRNIGKGKTQSNPSIDRIDNSLGYLKSNIRIISDLANSMKRESTIEQLKTFALNVLKIHS